MNNLIQFPKPVNDPFIIGQKCRPTFLGVVRYDYLNENTSYEIIDRSTCFSSGVFLNFDKSKTFTNECYVCKGKLILREPNNKIYEPICPFSLNRQLFTILN